MALRIARGLFRLWLVLSVLWVGAVVAVVWQQEDLFDWVIGRECPIDQNYKVVDESKCITHNVLLEELFVMTRNSAPMALIPPALVLLVGTAFVWAFKGFR
jgi:hypothetical protein